MSIAKFKPTAKPDIQPNLPKTAPKEYKSPARDEKVIPVDRLLAYVSGTEWTVDYYSQLTTKTNDLREVDPGEHPVYQQYTLTKKYAIKVTQANYPNTIQLGDVFNIDYSKIPKIDLLIGGSPCTYWSISKKDREITSNGLGFELFMQYVKALEICKPKYFLYENNYSIHENIKQAISEKLQCNYICINSNLVSGQQRKRLYWTNIPNITLPENKHVYFRDILENGTFREIPKCMYSNYGNRVRIKGLNYVKYDKSNTLTTNSTHTNQYLLKNDKSLCRLLSVNEYEKLQTLPCNYTEGVSKVQRYKMIGNGWTVDVIAHIFSFLNK